MKITINDIEIELKFSFAFFEKLKETWGLNTIQAVFEAFGPMVQGRELDACVEIIHVAAQVSKSVDASGITFTDCGEYIFENMSKMETIFGEIQKSFPQPEADAEPGKMIPVEAIPDQKQ